MKLELRRPFLVLVGKWNHAIFSPEWIGQHVFGVRVGEEFHCAILQGVQRQIVDDQTVDTPLPAVIYHRSVGLSCQPNRLEIYVNDKSDDAVGEAEVAAAKILETLPHTPIGPFGVNIQFVDSDPDASISDIIDTKEELGRIKPILVRDFRTRLNINDDCDLNLKRVYGDAGLLVDFNFHYKPRSVDETRVKIPGIFKAHYNMAVDLFGEKYQLPSIEEATLIQHDLEEHLANGDADGEKS